MNAFLQTALRQLREFFAKLSRKERIRLGLLAVLIIAFSITLALVLGRVNYAVLYTNLSTADAGKIMTALEELGVPIKTQGDDTILVPADRVGELRMRLEAQGYNAGDLSTSLIERAMGFGITAQDRETFDKLQLQSNLRTSIMRMNKIDDCLVLLTLQKESLYALNPNRTPSTASVVLAVSGGQALSASEAYSIGKVVEQAVPGLTLDNITITDSQMNLYPLDDEAGGANGASAIDYQVALREQIRDSLQAQVESLLIPVFGQGHVRAAVNVSLNFDQERLSSVTFAPPIEDETSGIVVSMKELYESSREGNAAEGVPGTDTNGLGVVEYPYEGLAADEYYHKVLREINYEINETRSEIERAQGDIRNLSIAVLLDSEAITEDYTANVRDLVAQALGVADRYISVQRLPFILDTTADDSWQSMRDFERGMELFKTIRTAIVALAVLLLGFLIFSFLRALARSLAPQQPLPALAGVGGRLDYLSPEEDLLQDLGLLTQYEAENSPDKIQTIKSEALEQLEKFIDRDPSSVAQLLRNWLGEDYR